MLGWPRIDSCMDITPVPRMVVPHTCPIAGNEAYDLQFPNILNTIKTDLKLTSLWRSLNTDEGSELWSSFQRQLLLYVNEHPDCTDACGNSPRLRCSLGLCVYGRELTKTSQSHRFAGESLCLTWNKHVCSSRWRYQYICKCLCVLLSCVYLIT